MNNEKLIIGKEEGLDESLKKRIFAGFKEHAIEKTGADGLKEISSMTIRDKQKVLGAIVYQEFWGAMHIKYIWVDKHCRNQGIGSKLMDKALQFGQEKKYSFAFVETMSFQALDFYIKHGFQLELTRCGYAKNTSFHYLRRDF